MLSLPSNSSFGSRLLPNTIDEIALHYPERSYAIIPRSSSLGDGFQDVSYSVFSKAINHMAFWLENKLGRNSKFDTLAYMGPPDIAYFIIVVAASKVGYKTLLPSPRNSVEGQNNLFTLTNCKTILTANNYPINPDLVSSVGVPIVNVPILSEIISDSSKSPDYPFPKTFEEAKNDPFVILHTSGSTGLPKPVVLNHGWLTSADNLSHAPEFNGWKILWSAFIETKILNSLPPFHAAGLVINLVGSVFCGCNCVWGPTNRPMSSILVDEMLDLVSIDMVLLAPSVLEELIYTPTSLEKLLKLKALAYAGGPLSRQAGNSIADKIPIINALGSTESMNLPIYLKDPLDWEYFHLSTDLKGLEMRPVSDGIYELVIVRHPSTDHLHAAFWTFPDAKEYNSNDLYEKHPTKEHLWLNVGRGDDVIVLSNGEKLNPTGMESTLRQHPSVKNALVVGQGRFAPAAILELVPSVARKLKESGKKDDYSKLLEEIWPIFEKANESAPAHARIESDKVFFATPGKAFLLTPKGTIRRGLTIKLYGDEIEDLYSRSEENDDIEKIHVDELSVDELETALKDVFGTVLVKKELDINGDLFNQAGMDSLHVMKIAKLLKTGLVGTRSESIGPRLIYANPTIGLLAAALKKMAGSNGVSGQQKSREEIMLEMLAGYIKQLPPTSTATAKTITLAKPGEDLTVILTGSTGSLGSYLLDDLLASPKVSKVICFNRRANAEEIQREANISRGLVSEWNGRVEFFQVDMSKPDFGLEGSVVDRLREEVGAIIHNQWQVDFNLNITSFIPHMNGVLNLINLASTAPLAPTIFFTSSISTLGNWPVKHPGIPVPESALDDPSIPLLQGYGESKWIAERLLDASNVKSSVWRVGQIAGPVGRLGGKWNVKEWFPSIMASSKYLNAVPTFPSSADAVNWMPVDVISTGLVQLVEKETVDLATSLTPTQTTYYNLGNPKTASWNTDLLSTAQSYLSKHGNGKEVEILPWDQWLERLEKSDGSSALNPGFKLLDFYKGMSGSVGEAVLDTKRTESGSQAMSDLKAVSGSWLELWLSQWVF